MAEFNKEVLTETSKEEDYTKIRCSVFLQALLSKEELDKLGYDKYIMSEVTFVPDNYIALDDETTEKVVALIEALEDIDDVQNVYHNLEM